MAIAKSGRALGKNEKVLLGAVLALSIVFIYWTLLLQPSLVKLKPLEAEVKTLKSQVKGASTIKASISNKETQLNSLKEQYEEATKIISKTDRYPQLIKEIRENATSKSLKISAESLGVPTVYAQQAAAPNGQQQSKAGLMTMSVKLTLDGDFRNVLDFINKLEEDKRILEVIGFTAQEKSSTVDLLYYISGGEENEEYDFNKGPYGKDNLFN